MKYLILLLLILTGCSTTTAKLEELMPPEPTKPVTGFDRHKEKPFEYKLIKDMLMDLNSVKSDPDNPKYKYWVEVKKYKIRLYLHVFYYYYTLPSGGKIGVRADCISENEKLTLEEEKIIRENARDYIEQNYKLLKDALEKEIKEKEKPKEKKKKRQRENDTRKRRLVQI